MVEIPEKKHSGPICKTLTVEQAVTPSLQQKRKVDVCVRLVFFFVGKQTVVGLSSPVLSSVFAVTVMITCTSFQSKDNLVTWQLGIVLSFHRNYLCDTKEVVTRSVPFRLNTKVNKRSSSLKCRATNS